MSGRWDGSEDGDGGGGGGSEGVAAGGEPPEDKPSVRARNALGALYEPAVPMEPASAPADWPGRAVDPGEPWEEGDGAAMLPDHRDPGFMDAVLNRLYLGEGRLRVLDLGDARLIDFHMPRLCDALGKSATLETLSLRANHLTHASMPHLADALLANRTLTALDISQNSVGQQGADELARALAKRPQITALDLSCCLLSDRGALATLQALLSGPRVTVRRLSLSENGLSDHTCAGISTLLDEGKALEHLDLSRNSFHAGGIKIISDELAVTRSLRHLSLAHVPMSSDMAQPLSHALRKNRSLVTLDLYGCNMGDRGATQMAKALALNKHLQRMDLGTNAIHAEGCSLLADALNVNTTLTVLKLWGNELRLGCNRLQAALLNNDSITELDVTGCLGPEEAVHILKSVVRKNRRAHVSTREKNRELTVLGGEVLALRDKVQGAEQDLHEKQHWISQLEAQTQTLTQQVQSAASKADAPDAWWQHSFGGALSTVADLPKTLGSVGPFRFGDSSQ